MQEILRSFDNTTFSWPDDMGNNIIGIGEWSLTEEYYRVKLATLLRLAVTHLRTFNSGLIQAITNNLDILLRWTYMGIVTQQMTLENGCYTNHRAL